MMSKKKYRVKVKKGKETVYLGDWSTNRAYVERVRDSYVCCSDETATLEIRELS